MDAYLEIADRLDPRKALDLSPTGQGFVCEWRPAQADLIAASDALRLAATARAQALEDAAKVLDNVAAEWARYAKGRPQETADGCLMKGADAAGYAAAIRALIPPTALVQEPEVKK